jgi:hypothetical protein
MICEIKTSTPPLFRLASVSAELEPIREIVEPFRGRCCCCCCGTMAKAYALSLLGADSKTLASLLLLYGLLLLLLWLPFWLILVREFWRERLPFCLLQNKTKLYVQISSASRN